MNKTRALTISTPSSRKAMRITLLAAALAASFPVAAGLSAITSRTDLNGKNNSNGMVVWFNSVMRTKGVPANRPVTICVTQQVITLRHGSETELIEVPDAVITFKPWETQAWTYGSDTKWDTSVPSSQAAGATFVSGEALPLPTGLPRDTRSMTWTARFESDTPGVSVGWEWGAAAYSHFGDSYGALGVSPANHRLRADSAGTPVAFKQFALGRERDRFRFTGSRSVTAKVPAEVTGRCGGVF